MVAQNILWTGQKFFYDSSGQKSNSPEGYKPELESTVSWPEPRFELFDENILKDRATGLLWPRNGCPAEFPLSWQEALQWIDQVNSENFLGKNDWRLPNRRELRSLIDHSEKKPALPQDHLFENVAIGWYWTSTSSAVNTRYAWYVHTEGGRMFYGNKTEYYWVLPVSGTSDIIPRTGQDICFDQQGMNVTCDDLGQDGSLRCGVQWPEPRFVTDTFGVLDQLTGLIWHHGATVTDTVVSWDDALEVIRGYAVETRQPFRLPTINELESLVDACSHSPALPQNHTFKHPQEAYWSSTTSGFEPDWAYVLYLHKGAVGVGYKPNRNFYVWPVMHKDQKKV